jgi:hypothetical protein
VPNSVQQGGLAVIDMPQNRHHRWTCFKIFRIFFQDHATPKGYFALFFDYNFFLLKLGFKAQFGCNNRCSIKVDLLVDAGHDAIGHQDFNHSNSAGVH